jgi:lipopolysaccharide/colanic/teichoic acid biosynthesis glycosyltransferase
MSVLDKKRVRKQQPKADVAAPDLVDLEAGIQIEPPGYFAWKGAVDRAVAAVLLVPGLPIIGVLVVLVRLTSRGPGLFRQSRVGQGGRLYMMYKIRTMREDAEAGTGPVWTQVRHDPRVTSLGRILRRFHLDEFPQLLNVLRGEMSLIGPRPERPEFVGVLAKAIPGYLNRLAVPPGITGLAQINLPPDTDLDSVRRKLVLDLDYIQQAGVWLDLRMFLCTFARLLGMSGPWVTHLFGVYRHVALPSDNGDAAAQGLRGASPVSLKSILARIEEKHRGNGSAGSPKPEPAERREGIPRRPR